MTNKALNEGTFCASDAAIAAGTTTTLTIGANTHFCVGGKAHYKAATSNITTPTTDAATGAAFTAIPKGTSLEAWGRTYVVCLDTSATPALKVVEGELVRATPGRTGATMEFLDAPEFPAIPDTICPIGYINVMIGNDLSAASWTFGSSNLATLTGCNRTFISCMLLPARPQTSA